MSDDRGESVGLLSWAQISNREEWKEIEFAMQLLQDIMEGSIQISKGPILHWGEVVALGTQERVVSAYGETPKDVLIEIVRRWKEKQKKESSSMSTAVLERLLMPWVKDIIDAAILRARREELRK